MPFLEDNVKDPLDRTGTRGGHKNFSDEKPAPAPHQRAQPGPGGSAGLPRSWVAGSRRAGSGLPKKRRPSWPKGCPFSGHDLLPRLPPPGLLLAAQQALKQDNRHGFVCGDIGCYTMGAIGCGFNTVKTSHAMGSGTGMASGFGKLNRFGFDQPVWPSAATPPFFTR
jgi:indolepyruvate ferredoxin oxidoreductase alpha subunit